LKGRPFLNMARGQSTGATKMAPVPGSADSKEESSLSVVTDSGLVRATFTSTDGTSSPPTSSLNDGFNTSIPKAAASASSASSSSSAAAGASAVTGSLSPALDFITTGNAIKALFSIPYDNSPEPVFLAVHNINGTLLIDEAESEHNYDTNVTTGTSWGGRPHDRHQNDTMKIPPSSEEHLSQPLKLPPSEVLALALSPRDQHQIHDQQTSQALKLLSNLINRSAVDPEGNDEDEHYDDNCSSGTNNNKNGLAPPVAPKEFIEWKFHDFTLMVASDALIVRPSSQPAGSSTTSTMDSIAIRVEQKRALQQAWKAFQARQQQFKKKHLLPAPKEEEKDDERGTATAKSPTASHLSYAQALKQPPKTKTKKGDDVKGADEQGNLTSAVSNKSNGDQEEEQRQQQQQQITTTSFSEIPLQTCIVPHASSLGSAIPLPSSSSNNDSQSKSTAGAESTPELLSTVSVVLDAYLDNLMANVPQLALCLQEKGLIQSVKLLQTEDIPSRLIHPSTFDSSIGAVNSPTVTAEEERFFSPQIMDMNATALLRFLKANCTRNNSTYLLRHEPIIGPHANNATTTWKGNNDNMGQRQIQLYDISSISTQGQKKWIWWLATMSHRFALRLRHLETSSSSSQSLTESQKRELRDRQRSLFQQTLDLIQDLSDMDGNAHESMVASVCEHMADTFLGGSDWGRTAPGPAEEAAGPQSTSFQQPNNQKIQSNNAVLTTTTVRLDIDIPEGVESLNHKEVGRDGQPYLGVSIDALNKAQGYLMSAICSLNQALKEEVTTETEASASSNTRRRKRPGTKQNRRGNNSERESTDISISPMVVQLYGLNNKLVDVSLRLVEHYLRNYSSSNAMQSLRLAARKLAESIKLVESSYDSLVTRHGGSIARIIKLQYMWLYESCGHFSRSFASDVLWRERGHANGDDIISVIRDVDVALCQDKTRTNQQPLPPEFRWIMHETDTLSEKSNGLVTLHSLTGVVSTNGDAVQAAEAVLAKEKVLQRDKRKVLVASCISYDTVTSVLCGSAETGSNGSLASYSEFSRRLIFQLFGDSCNETGKMLLSALRNHLAANQGQMDNEAKAAAIGMMDSAQFWFMEGLNSFEACGDFQNRALLRMNLCQSFKLRANNAFDNVAKNDKSRSTASSNAEKSLEEAVKQLEKAQEELGQRDVAPHTWDMVSAELASTFLLLGTRRRRVILGDGGNPLALALTRRLQPGQEHSILDPMERSLQIYEERGNGQQAAAVHYQLALTFSKLWTCQVNEAKTRQKLSSAFEHYQKAHGYYFGHLRGNESVFCLLCMDLSKLYCNIPGEGTLVKALGCCLDTCDAFSKESILTAIGHAPTSTQSSEWLETMTAIAQSVDETTFKTLRSLVQLEKGNGDRYKDIYRAGLTAKMVRNVPNEGDEDDGENEDDESTTMHWLVESHPQAAKLLSLHDVLVALKTLYPKIMLK
jgi:hypothetical protein